MLQNGKARIERRGTGMFIEMPSRKNWAVLIFATLWLGGWAAALNMVWNVFIPLNQTSPAGDGPMGTDLFLVFWLMAWTAGGLGVLFMLLWGYWGRESLSLAGSTLTLRKSIFGVGRSWHMDLGEVSSFRFSPQQTNWWSQSRLAMYGLGPGKIQIDHGLRTRSLGLGLDDTEARYIVALLEQHQS